MMEYFQDITPEFDSTTNDSNLMVSQTSFEPQKHCVGLEHERDCHKTPQINTISGRIYLPVSFHKSSPMRQGEQITKLQQRKQPNQVAL